MGRRVWDRILNSRMIRILGTIFAGLLGLAFGSFLNVCLSRWPVGESVVSPRSHCRNCEHTLAWWENIPLVSWVFLRGRCRNCHTAISWRYPLVELSVGALWALVVWRSFLALPLTDWEIGGGMMLFTYSLVGLAVLDAEHLWLPDIVTVPMAAIGIAWFALLASQADLVFGDKPEPWKHAGERVLAALATALLILLIRWLYKLIRHRDGLGLGDAKLMAMLAAWLGLPGALLAFVLGSILGALAALVLLALPAARTDPRSWATSKLPFGTFLCVGGIVSSLWGQPIIEAYLRWAGI